jgi:hypothetical protein
MVPKLPFFSMLIIILFVAFSSPLIVVITQAPVIVIAFSVWSIIRVIKYFQTRMLPKWCRLLPFYSKEENWGNTVYSLHQMLARKNLLITKVGQVQTHFSVFGLYASLTAIVTVCFSSLHQVFLKAFRQGASSRYRPVSIKERSSFR